MMSKMQQGKRGEVGVHEEARYGDGVAWRRGAMLGKGSFGCVYMASLKKPRSKYSYFPSVMAVKSAEVSLSASIQKEREVLNKIKGNPYIIRCFGDETTIGENGEMVYNLLLEYGSGGTLAQRINTNNKSGLGLPELEVRFHTRSLLRGLNHIHLNGYVHCDLKPDNIFLVPSSGEVNKGIIGFQAKIGDFGLSKRQKQSKKRRLEAYWRGTPIYLSPEVVKDCVQEPPSDIWALGCIVLEMLTGKPPWAEEGNLDVNQILRKIEQGQLPRIPTDLSKPALEFLKACFVKNDMYRFTAELLLNHPFVQGLDLDDDNDWKFQDDVEEVEDINVIDSILLVSDIADEFGSANSPGGWSCVSEDDEDSIYYWTEDEDDVQGIGEDYEDSSSVGNQNPGDLTPSTETGFDISSTSLQVLPEVPSNARQKYPIDFTICAGV